MQITTFEGIVTNGQIHLTENVELPEMTKVYVVIPPIERAKKFVNHPSNKMEDTNTFEETTETKIGSNPEASLTDKLNHYFSKKSPKAKVERILNPIDKLELAEFFNNVVLPAFEKVQKRVAIFPVKTVTKIFTYKSRLDLFEKKIKFQFRVDYDTYFDKFEIFSHVYYQYKTFEYHDECSFNKREVNSNDYKNVSQEQIVDWVIEDFLIKDKAIRKSNEEEAKHYEKFKPTMNYLIATKQSYDLRDAARKCQRAYQDGVKDFDWKERTWKWYDEDGLDDDDDFSI